MSRRVQARSFAQPTARVSVADGVLPSDLAAACPRLAAELAQPTPGGPKRAPINVPRVTLACGLDSGRESGVLSHLRVAQLSIAVAGPPLGHATISLYLVLICLGWGMEASPGVNVSVPDLPDTHLARGGRSIT